jgi:hypothetical protein
MLLVFVFLSNVAVFGQTSFENNGNLNSTILDKNIEIKIVAQEVTTNTPNMNFVIWFMGSKQNPNAAVLPVGENTKKQFISSGLAPNRLLIKAFLKKAVNLESSLS